MAPETKVYTVLVAFEANGLAYAAGEKYELTDEVVATLAPETVELFVEEVPPAQEVPPATETPSVTAQMGTVNTVPSAPEIPSAGATAPAPEEKKEATPAPSWVGGHTVGRE